MSLFRWLHRSKHEDECTEECQVRKSAAIQRIYNVARDTDEKEEQVRQLQRQLQHIRREVTALRGEK